MKKRDLHPLDKVALGWEKEEESFFLDTDFSEDYVQIELPVGKKHTSQIKDHNILKSKNLVDIFDRYYREIGNTDFVPYFNMISSIFKNDFIPPHQVDLGEVLVYSNENITDVISGFEGNFDGTGWLMSDKLISILRKFNIGETNTYPVTITHKNKTYDNFKYFRFINYGDKFVDFDKSVFYKQKGLLNFGSREKLRVKSFQDIDGKRKQLNQTNDINISIRPKELFLKPNNLDLFTFSNLHTIDLFCSIKLVEKLESEKITGFKYIKTTKIKTANTM